MGFGIFTNGSNGDKQLGEVVISTQSSLGDEYLKIPTDTSFNLKSAEEIGADSWFYDTLESYPLNFDSDSNKIFDTNIKTLNNSNDLSLDSNKIEALNSRIGMSSNLNTNAGECYFRYFPGVGKIITPDEKDFKTSSDQPRSLFLIDENNFNIYYFSLEHNFIPWYCQKFNKDFRINDNIKDKSGYLISGRTDIKNGTSVKSISYFLAINDNNEFIDIYKIIIKGKDMNNQYYYSNTENEKTLIKSICFQGNSMAILYNARPTVADSDYHRLAYFPSVYDFTYDNETNTYIIDTKAEGEKNCYIDDLARYNYIIPYTENQDTDKFILLALNSYSEYDEMPEFDKIISTPTNDLIGGNKSTNYTKALVYIDFSEILQKHNSSQSYISLTSSQLHNLLPTALANKENGVANKYQIYYSPDKDKIVFMPALTQSSTVIKEWRFICENISQGVNMNIFSKLTQTNENFNYVYNMLNDKLITFTKGQEKIIIYLQDNCLDGSPRVTSFEVPFLDDSLTLFPDIKAMPGAVSNFNQYLNSYFGTHVTDTNNTKYTIIAWNFGYVLPTFSLNNDSWGNLNAFIKIK